MNVIGKEPVIVQMLATLVVWAATRYGLHVSDEQALQIAGGAFVVLAPFVRQLVSPVAKQVTIGRTLTATQNSTGELKQVVVPQEVPAPPPAAG